MQKQELPEPDLAEQQHSQQLLELIKQKIAESAGWLDFSSYMALVLYAPGLGYYSAGRQKFGESGDFITAPEVSALFGQTLASPIAEVLASMDQACLIEFGAGSGKLAGDVLNELQALNRLPEKYFIIELSADLKHRQQQYLAQTVPDFYHRIEWLDRLPETKLNAVVLANEVLDAMPVQRFVKTAEAVQALGVKWQDDRLVYSLQLAKDNLSQAVQHIEQDIARELSEDYSSEINMNISPWLQSVADILQQAVVYLIDYGYPRAEYYSVERYMGTSMCYYQHRALDDAFYLPGLMDVTAFVDFTAVAEAAQAAGFDVDGFTSQANFLINCGLAQRVEKEMSDEVRAQLSLTQQMKTLTLPSEMGERFKVMGLSKNFDALVPGFGIRDFRNRL